jgi:hypothetical protein
VKETFGQDDEPLSDPNLSPGPQNPSKALRFMSADVEGLYDAFRQTIYWSDRLNHRVMGYQLRDPFLPENMEIEAYMGPEVKAPRSAGTRQILMLNTSLGVHLGLGDDGNRRRSIWKQFELQLNMRNALKGTGQRFEVATLGGNLTFTQGILGYALNRLESIEKISPECVIAVVENRSLMMDLLNAAAARSADDLVAKKIDPEWNLLPQEEREAVQGPLVKELFALVRKEKAYFDPYIKISGDGRLLVGHSDPQFALLGHKSFMDLLLKFQEKTLQKLEAAYKGKPYRLMFLYLPYGNGYSTGDIQGGIRQMEGPVESLNVAFGRLAAAHGFTVLDLVPAFKAVGPSLFPVLPPGGNHYLAAGHRWIAQIAAERYFEQQKEADASVVGAIPAVQAPAAAK